ncbi:hypothetical protein P9850_12685 [Anoxybacillus rupiensis]|uniref:Phage protein n=1 Tax=Anoxybacteroides rupiense TaxID=311460 RepID=A0ABD5IZ80_9BACL|nr:hypothetical protein [Anoxybacillus rupiensis]
MTVDEQIQRAKAYSDFLAEEYLKTDNLFAEELIVEEIHRLNLKIEQLEKAREEIT